MSLRRKFQGGGADAGASSRSGDMGAGAGVSRGITDEEQNTVISYQTLLQELMRELEKDL